MPFLAVRDLQLYHEFHGDGPPLLHISGSGGDLRATLPERHPLNRHFRGLHYDQRGLGRTSQGDHEPTMADFADDAATLCAAVGWERCRVIGTSFGGMVAQHLAIRHPALVDRLVLNCTSPGGPAPSYPLHELGDLDPADGAETWMTLLDTRYTPETGLPGLEAFTPTLRERRAVPLPDERAEGYARQLEARRHHDVTAGLGTIEAPTLVCAGRFDAIAPVANSERIAAAIPGARLDVFDGGHLFQLQDRRAMRVIAEFLAG